MTRAWIRSRPQWGKGIDRQVFSDSGAAVVVNNRERCRTCSRSADFCRVSAIAVSNDSTSSADVRAAFPEKPLDRIVRNVHLLTASNIPIYLTIMFAEKNLRGAADSREERIVEVQGVESGLPRCRSACVRGPVLESKKAVESMRNRSLSRGMKRTGGIFLSLPVDSRMPLVGR